VPKIKSIQLQFDGASWLFFCGHTVYRLTNKKYYHHNTGQITLMLFHSPIKS